MSKKLISVIMLVTFIFSCFPVLGAHTGEEYSRLIEYGIVKCDENGNLNDDYLITRSEVAQLIINILQMDSVKYPGVANEKFSDVFQDHPAYDAIMNAAALGIVSGYGDGTFCPDRTATFVETVKMIVASLGYNPVAEARGGWFDGYIKVAENTNLTKGFKHKAGDFVLKKDVLTLLERALDIPLMVQTGFGSNVEYQILDGKNGVELKTLEMYFK